jgi:hypothetical protein
MTLPEFLDMADAVLSVAEGAKTTPLSEEAIVRLLQVLLVKNPIAMPSEIQLHREAVHERREALASVGRSMAAAQFPGSFGDPS